MVYDNVTEGSPIPIPTYKFIPYLYIMSHCRLNIIFTASFIE